MKAISTKVISALENTVIDTPSIGTEAYVWADLEFAHNISFLSQFVNLLLGGCGASVAYVFGALGESVLLNSNIGKDKWGNR